MRSVPAAIRLPSEPEFLVAEEAVSALDDTRSLIEAAPGRHWRFSEAWAIAVR